MKKETRFIPAEHSTEFPNRQTSSAKEGLPADIAVVIPAWQPDQRLLALVSELQQAGLSRMILVDDGSAAMSQPIFCALASLDGVTVLRHAANCGKGRALKTAFSFVLASQPDVRGVVTADADGQHLPSDILAVLQGLSSQPDQVLLGVRDLQGEVPLRSRVGNQVTRWIFALLTGRVIRDTQTGLRGLPFALLPELLALPGERYEYETVALAHLCQTGRPPREQLIQTVYLQGNRGSHFQPLRDSLCVTRALVASTIRRAGRPGAKVAVRGKADGPHLHAA